MAGRCLCEAGTRLKLSGFNQSVATHPLHHEAHEAHEVARVGGSPFPIEGEGWDGGEVQNQAPYPLGTPLGR